MRRETWPAVHSRTVRFSSLVITTFRAQWNAAFDRSAFSSDGRATDTQINLSKQKFQQRNTANVYSNPHRARSSFDQWVFLGCLCCLSGHVQFIERPVWHLVIRLALSVPSPSYYGEVCVVTVTYWTYALLYRMYRPAHQQPVYHSALQWSSQQACILYRF